MCGTDSLHQPFGHVPTAQAGLHVDVGEIDPVVQHLEAKRRIQTASFCVAGIALKNDVADDLFVNDHEGIGCAWTEPKNFPHCCSHAAIVRHFHSETTRLDPSTRQERREAPEKPGVLEVAMGVHGAGQTSNDRIRLLLVHAAALFGAAIRPAEVV